jgi:hypothetical protein
MYRLLRPWPPPWKQLCLASELIRPRFLWKSPICSWYKAHAMIAHGEEPCNSVMMLCKRFSEVNTYTYPQSVTDFYSDFWSGAGRKRNPRPEIAATSNASIPTKPNGNSGMSYQQGAVSSPSQSGYLGTSRPQQPSQQQYSQPSDIDFNRLVPPMQWPLTFDNLMLSFSPTG